MISQVVPEENQFVGCLFPEALIITKIVGPAATCSVGKSKIIETIPMFQQIVPRCSCFSGRIKFCENRIVFS